MNEIKIPKVHRICKRTIDSYDDETIYKSSLMKVSNNLIFIWCPVTTSLTLKSIDNELDKALKSKINILNKLKDKYNVMRSKSINIVQELIINDFEMSIDGNVKLIPDAHISLMRSSRKNDLIQLLIKNINKNIGGNIEKEFEKVYNLLRYSCEYKFPELCFESDYTPSITDETLNKRIVQVWTIFQQYFKQFNYINYLDNFVIIKKEAHDLKSTFALIRILLEIGPIVC